MDEKSRIFFGLGSTPTISALHLEPNADKETDCAEDCGNEQAVGVAKPEKHPGRGSHDDGENLKEAFHL